MPRRARTTRVVAGLTVVAGVVGVAVLAGLAWAVQRGRDVGVTPAPPGACARSAAPAAAATRPEAARYLVPVSPRTGGPVSAVVCRYGAGGTLQSSIALDAGRTAALVGVLASPLAPWPSDPLAAKVVPTVPATPVAPPPAANCPAGDDGRAVVVRLGYDRGAPVTLRLRPGPCRDLTNGVVTVPLTERVESGVAALLP